MAESAEVTTETIAPSGNVILVVGEPAKVKLLVSSSTLSGASKVFAALLGPNFLEGQGLDNLNQPKEVSLPDDDATAMSDICHLLHNKPVQALSKSGNSERILKFAIAVNKYACEESLQLQSKGILLTDLSYGSPSTPKSVSRCMIAAYLLDSDHAFTNASGCLVRGSTDHYAMLLDSNYSQLIPANILYALEVKRANANQNMAVELSRFGAAYGNKCSKGCDVAYMKALCKAFDIPSWPPDLRPGSGPTIDLSTECLKAFSILGIKGGCGTNGGNLACLETRGFYVTSKAKNLAVELDKMSKGLCLRCVKENKSDLVTTCEDKQHSLT